MMGRVRSGRARTELTCEQVREVMSAGLDGEVTGIRAGRIAAHVAQCRDCRDFQLAAPTLDSLLGVSVSRPVPGALKEMLREEWSRSPGGTSRLSPSRRRHIGPGHTWRRRVQWIGALTPAVLLVVILPLGALPGPHMVPSHASTPCTVDLHEVHGRAPR
jgi:predicted anti-sigma-YlaC factor YlaD